MEFTDRLETLLGDGNLSLFQTFSQSKTIKELTDRITTDELANIFASEKTAEQMLDSLTNSVLKEKLKEVHKDNIKQDIKLEEKASEKQVAPDHEFDWVVL